MTRRLIELLVTLTRAILMALLAAAAQQPANVHLIGTLGTGFPPLEARRQSSPVLQKLRSSYEQEALFRLHVATAIARYLIHKSRTGSGAR
jgi:hypothetical protein